MVIEELKRVQDRRDMSGKQDKILKQRKAHKPVDVGDPTRMASSIENSYNNIHDLKNPITWNVNNYY